MLFYFFSLGFFSKSKNKDFLLHKTMSVEKQMNGLPVTIEDHAHIHHFSRVNKFL
jgi:hypothetical protein